MKKIQQFLYRFLFEVKYAPLATVAAMIVGILLVRTHIGFFEVVGGIMFVVAALLLIAFFLLSRMKYQEGEVPLITSITAEELYGYLKEGNFTYPKLSGIELKDEKVILQFGWLKAYTVAVKQDHLVVSGGKTNSHDYVMAKAVEAFLYPNKNIDLEAHKRKALWPSKLKPYLYLGLAISFVVFLLSDPKISYQINGWISSDGISTSRISGYSNNIGNAYGDFFEPYPKWTSYKEGAQKYVDISGNLEIDGQVLPVIITYASYEDSASITDCKISGMSYGHLVGSMMQDAAMSGEAFSLLGNGGITSEWDAIWDTLDDFTDSYVEDSLTEYFGLGPTGDETEPQESYQHEPNASYDIDAFADMLNSYAGTSHYISYGDLGEWFAQSLENGDRLYEALFGAASIEILVDDELLRSDDDGGWPLGTTDWNLFYVISYASDSSYQKTWSSDENVGADQVWLTTKLQEYPIELEFGFWVDVENNSFTISRCWATSEDGSVLTIENALLDGLLNYISSIWQEGPGLSYYFPEYIDIN